MTYCCLLWRHVDQRIFKSINRWKLPYRITANGGITPDPHCFFFQNGLLSEILIWNSNKNYIKYWPWEPNLDRNVLNTFSLVWIFFSQLQQTEWRPRTLMHYQFQFRLFIPVRSCKYQTMELVFYFNVYECVKKKIGQRIYKNMVIFYNILSLISYYFV